MPVRPTTRSLLLTATLLSLTLAAPGCMPLPPGSLIATGPVSDQWAVRWDPVLRTPSLMTNQSLQDVGELRDAVAASDTVAELAVRAVFEERFDWFQIRPGLDGIRVVRSYSKGWLRYLRIVQVYRGLPVAGGGYEARVFPNGRVGSLEGRFFPNLEIDVDPVLGAESAEAQARVTYTAGPANRTDVPRFQFEYETGFHRERHVLTVVPRERDYVLAWAVVIQAEPTEYVRVYVDARNGEVIGGERLGNTWVR